MNKKQYCCIDCCMMDKQNKEFAPRAHCRVFDNEELKYDSISGEFMRLDSCLDKSDSVPKLIGTKDGKTVEF